MPTITVLPFLAASFPALFKTTKLNLEPTPTMPTRFLLPSVDRSPAPPPPMPKSNGLVILAAMLCGLICIIGLAVIALCAWLRRRAAAAASSVAPPTPSKGLKKKVLQSLPSFSFDGSKPGDGEFVECAICLAEFAEGEEIRMLPQCGHRFHVGCVDTWLGGHSSCPSCRRVLVVPTAPQCITCGGAPVAELAS